MSMTSTDLAVLTVWSHRRMRRSVRRWTTSFLSRRATPRAKWCRSARLISVKESFGPDIVERFNGYSSADINGGPSPGHSSGQAQAAISKILDETLPSGMTLRVDRPRVSADRRRRRRAVRVPAVRAVRVPGAGRAVRELHAAARDHPDRADGAAGRTRGRLAPGRRQQHLHADRLPGAGGPRVQERHPDRGVRQAPAGDRAAIA